MQFILLPSSLASVSLASDSCSNGGFNCANVDYNLSDPWASQDTLTLVNQLGQPMDDWTGAMFSALQAGDFYPDMSPQSVSVPALGTQGFDIQLSGNPYDPPCCPGAGRIGVAAMLLNNLKSHAKVQTSPSVDCNDGLSGINRYSSIHNGSTSALLSTYASVCPGTKHTACGTIPACCTCDTSELNYAITVPKQVKVTQGTPLGGDWYVTLTLTTSTACSDWLAPFNFLFAILPAAVPVMGLSEAEANQASLAVAGISTGYTTWASTSCSSSRKRDSTSTLGAGNQTCTLNTNPLIKIVGNGVDFVNITSRLVPAYITSPTQLPKCDCASDGYVTICVDVIAPLSGNGDRIITAINNNVTVAALEKLCWHCNNTNIPTLSFNTTSGFSVKVFPANGNRTEYPAPPPAVNGAIGKEFIALVIIAALMW
ncbi:hypothetical protein HK100_001413 [Physocladia obscura]|uniref:Uncharacterized protein n=1 Tax=Physocladia obscura TaxID=109957 RepID=A0AAD5T2V0_9FUNG|nr:hypothetical protein HK100_001413 [Physocladia obscura]